MNGNITELLSHYYLANTVVGDRIQTVVCVAVGGGLLTYLMTVRLPVIVNLIPLICSPGSKRTYLFTRIHSPACTWCVRESVIGKWQTTTKLLRDLEQ